MWNKQSRFTALVNAFTPDLYRYAFWLCGEAATAEDLVQETFTRAWRSLDKLREEHSANTWLITALRRENARRFARKRLTPTNVDEIAAELGLSKGAVTTRLFRARNKLRRVLTEDPNPVAEETIR